MANLFVFWQVLRLYIIVITIPTITPHNFLNLVKIAWCLNKLYPVSDYLAALTTEDVHI